MKKLLLSLTTLAFLTQIDAQTIERRHPLLPDNQAVEKVGKPSNTKFGKADVEDWYSPGAWLLKDPTISSGIKGYVDFMYHDTLAKSILIGSTGTESTIYGFGRISIAGILDPKDDVLDYTDNPGIKLYRNNSYKVDSIHFSYRYVRQVDSISDGVGGKLPVIDTLFVTYFNGSMISKSGLTFSSTPPRTVKYGKVNWTGGTVRMPSTYLSQDTILLTPTSDTTMYKNNNGGWENSWPSFKEMTLATPSNMTSAKDQDNNLVGFALTFKSAVPSVIGTDTAIMIYQKDPATLAPGTRRTNYFGFSLFQNEGTARWSNPTFYNTSLTVENFSGYTPWVVNSTVTFNGYIPGCIWNAGDQFTVFDYYLKTTSGNVGVKDIKNNEFVLGDIYPNPVLNGEKAMISFNLLHNAPVTIAVMNMVGQEVKTGYTRNYSAGKQTEVLDLNGLKAGVYFVNMTVNGNSISKKLTIVE
jgi:hypothetical protein